MFLLVISRVLFVRFIKEVGKLAKSRTVSKKNFKSPRKHLIIISDFDRGDFHNTLSFSGSLVVTCLPIGRPRKSAHF